MLDIYLSNENFLLSSSSSLLPSLDINENLHIILRNNGVYQIVSSFWTSIFNDKRLRSLSLINLQLNENDALLLIQYLHEQIHLIKLTIDSVHISINIFNRIINDGLQNNTSIKYLTISRFENLNITIIGNLIKYNKYIEYLSLKYNNISSDNIIIITDALQINTKLKSINLSHNHIGKTGTLILTNLFQQQQQHPSLRYINLIDNDIDNNTQQIIHSQYKNLINITFSIETEPILISKELINNKKSMKKKSQFFSFILITFIFFIWGIPHQLNTILIRQFMKIFILNRFEASFVQSTFFMGYFILALPAAYILHHWGYKFVIILGFVLFGTGSFLFWPAALTGYYTPFLLALFILATGLAFLEIAANPYISNVAGPIETSEIRLNIAQAFNPLGVIIGVFMGRYFLYSDMNLNEKDFEQINIKIIYDDYLKTETLRIVQPYAILGGIAFLWAILIAMISFPIYKKNSNNKKKENKLCYKIFLFSIIAQFVYIGAQVGTWSYFIQYIQDNVDILEKTSNYLLISTLALFTIGRFIAALFMYFGCSSSIILAICSFINVILVIIIIFIPNSIGVAALVFTSFFMAPMFPTIFALGIKNMDESKTKLASCLLVMTLISGAICPPLMGFISVKTKRLAFAFILPGIAYIIVGIFALFTYGFTRME